MTWFTVTWDHISLAFSLPKLDWACHFVAACMTWRTQLLVLKEEINNIIPNLHDFLLQNKKGEKLDDCTGHSFPCNVLGLNLSILKKMQKHVKCIKWSPYDTDTIFQIFWSNTIHFNWKFKVGFGLKKLDFWPSSLGMLMRVYVKCSIVQVMNTYFYSLLFLMNLNSQNIWIIHSRTWLIWYEYVKAYFTQKWTHPYVIPTL